MHLTTGGRGRGRIGAIAALAAALLASGGAVAAIRVPGCAELEELAMAVNAEDRVPINRWVTVPARSAGLTLTAAVAAADFATLFGAPLLDWSRDDLSGFATAVNDCMKAASRAKRFDAQKQLIELRRVVQFHFSQPGNAVQRARQEVAGNLAALDSLPAGMDKLRLFGLLGRMQELNQQQAVIEVRQPIERLRGDGATPARLVAAHIHSLPQAEADAHFAMITRTRDRLVTEVVDGLERQLAQVPGSVEGLAAIEGVLAETRGELAAYAPPARLTSLTEAADRERERVWRELEATVAGLPDTAAGGSQLAAMRSGPGYPKLSGEDRQRLDLLVRARQQQVARAAIQGPIERLRTFPATLEGLRQCVGFARETRAELGRQFAPDARQAFENAYAEVHPALIDAVQDEFERYLEDVPETREGARQIGTLLREIDAPARSELYLAGLGRAQAIAASVQRAERAQQCAAAMPDLELDEDAAARPVLALGGTPALGDLLCDIALAGNRVHEYDGPGFFDDDHVVKITGRDGIFRTYTLNPAAVGPDRQALVGVAVADPTSERTLAVEDWRAVLATLLPDSPAGRDARCSRLMNTPERDLTASDRMAAVGCVMNSLLGQ